MRFLALLLVGLTTATPALAQELQLNLGGASLTGQTLQLFGVITLLSIAPGIAVMVTCFPFLVTVLSILRQAIGLQQAPPNMLLVSLALFLTWFIMEPTFTAAWQQGIQPLSNGSMPLTEALPRIVSPFRAFMGARVEGNTLATLAALRPLPQDISDPAAAPLSILVPSFMLSEIQRAFEIGFLIYLPFLIIDLVVSAVLMSMGMMMVPPSVVALPFKLAFFVVADGWSLISGALVRSYF